MTFFDFSQASLSTQPYCVGPERLRDVTAAGRGWLVSFECWYVKESFSVIIIWSSKVFHLPLAVPKGPRKVHAVLVETRKSHPGLPCSSLTQ